MSIDWLAEARDLPPDPVSGARITRLTSAPCINNNIYCEQPYCSADGTRAAVVRTDRFVGAHPRGLLAADLVRLKLHEIDVIDPGGSVCTSAWKGWIYYQRTANDLMRVSLDTLQKEVVLTRTGLPAGCSINSISPDFRYGVGRMVLPGPTIGILQLDLTNGEQRLLFSHPEIVNPHLQYNPVHGRQLLVQHNRGSEMTSDGRISKIISEQGTTLFVVDTTTAEMTPLPVGPPHTAPATGHECFCADTGKVAFSVGWNHRDWSLDERFPTGNLFTARPGDAKPTVFAAPEHRFNHVCVSRCGKYVLCDSYPDPYLQAIPLVVGNLETGKYATLLQNCGASGGGAQYTHPHAYFTSDTRRVVYNADPHGVPHVFSALIPDGFLEALD